MYVGFTGMMSNAKFIEDYKIFLRKLSFLTEGVPTSTSDVLSAKHHIEIGPMVLREEGTFPPLPCFIRLKNYDSARA